MTDRILYVDDDPNILAACRRSVGRSFHLQTTESPEEALRMLRDDGPFAVLLSDMRMPVMNGIELICEARKIAPETVYMMLTGNADQQTAVDAVNEGQIFRFLNKPCPNELLSGALKAGLEQYRLVTAERNLLQKTLTGSIRVLTEVLELVNPRAFSRGLRIKPVVKALASELGLRNSWQYEIAALLSQLGSIILPPAIIEKYAVGSKLTEEEQAIFNTHPASAAKLIENIPRLDKAAQMILHQLDRYDEFPVSPEEGGIREEELGGQILHAAIDFDLYMERGLGRSYAIRMMKKYAGEYNPEIVHLLETAALPGIDEAPAGHEDQLAVWQLGTGMVALEDITAQSGMLLVPKGNQMNHTLITRLRNFASGVGINEPIRVFVPDVAMTGAA